MEILSVLDKFWFLKPLSCYELKLLISFKLSNDFVILTVLYYFSKAQEQLNSAFLATKIKEE